MAKNRKIFLSALKISNETFKFYDDTTELLISGKTKWNTNGKLIDSIEFIPTKRKGDANYEIIGVNFCKNSNLGFPFHMVHIYMANDALNNKPFEAINNKHLNNIEFIKKGDNDIFLFNIYDERPQGNINSHELGCIFNGREPETKDGSIIVAI